MNPLAGYTGEPRSNITVGTICARALLHPTTGVFTSADPFPGLIKRPHLCTSIVMPIPILRTKSIQVDCCPDRYLNYYLACEYKRPT